MTFYLNCNENGYHEIFDQGNIELAKSVHLHMNARIEDSFAFFKRLANFKNIKEIYV